VKWSERDLTKLPVIALT